MTINSGGGNDDISTNNTKGDITVNSQGGANNLTIQYGDGNMFINLYGSGEDTINLFEIAGNLDIHSGGGNDHIMINQVSGDSLLIDLGEGDDRVYIDGTVFGGTVLGGAGNDMLVFDARGNNTMDGSYLDWNGGEGDDTVDLYFHTAGTSNLNIFGDDGSDQVIARCPDEACTILLRESFLAYIHEPGTNVSSMERINLDPAASVAALFIYLNGGENNVYFDDTFAITNVFGGADNDAFHIGQIYYDVSTAIDANACTCFLVSSYEILIYCMF